MKRCHGARAGAWCPRVGARGAKAGASSASTGARGTRAQGHKGCIYSRSFLQALTVTVDFFHFESPFLQAPSSAILITMYHSTDNSKCVFNHPGKGGEGG